MNEIEQIYRERHPTSIGSFQEARLRFPSGVTHDGRLADPFPLSIEHAHGAYKWDIDGNRLIDYWMGHGALLLGHSHPAIVRAVQQQVERGTHLGGSTAHELHWARLIVDCFPSIERLRFTASGTEATMLALRLARAFTGKPMVLRFAGHFHGWSDALATGAEGHSLSPAGLPPGPGEATLVLDPDLDAVARTLRERNDIAAVIVEPTGASYGAQPLPAGFVQDLRSLTRQYDVLLICDEVVTGFRVAPGGQQERANFTADLTCLAKILAGGLPGGAVGGRADVMEHLAVRDREWNERYKVRHHGTFNANPLSAAAGCAALAIIRDGTLQQQAAQTCAALVAGMNDRLRAEGLYGWAAYGDSSIFHLVVGASVDFAPGEPAFDRLSITELKAGGASPQLRKHFRLALLNEGVDLMKGIAGFVSTAHSEAEVTATLDAFERAIAAVRRAGFI